MTLIAGVFHFCAQFSLDLISLFDIEKSGARGSSKRGRAGNCPWLLPNVFFDAPPTNFSADAKLRNVLGADHPYRRINETNLPIFAIMAVPNERFFDGCRRFFGKIRSPIAAHQSWITHAKCARRAVLSQITARHV